MTIKDRALKVLTELSPRILDAMTSGFKRLDPRIVTAIEHGLKSIPGVDKGIEKQYQGVLDEIEPSVRPYRGEYPSFSKLPETGRDQEEILGEMAALNSREESIWKDGKVSGAVYHGEDGHVDFLNKVYYLTSQMNPLHSDIWPSVTKYEAEVVSMTASMLHGDAVSRDDSDDEVSGVVSSGGTESILLAMKTYRDFARAERGIRKPEMVVPSTAHAAFDKAAEYFKIKMIRVPVGDDYRADVQATSEAITKNTIVLVGSAPDFPHGQIDPIAELSELARSHGIGFHTDACLGGFVLPWAEKLGYPVPPFDFRLPGVTSISADTHKYGYAAKGSSVILYRNKRLIHHQYYATGSWPGGLYFSPTFAGSRPGALSAMCWAAMLSMGESGYKEACSKILEVGVRIKQGIAAIPELEVIGDPLFCIAFRSNGPDIYQVAGLMNERQWSLNGLFDPPAVHICLTLRHTHAGFVDSFLEDLNEAVRIAKESPDQKGEGTMPVYGLAASLPFKGFVTDLLKRYLDILYKV
jgi:glutamate/tyrosine decarboxylase-like PLP-dependent enzyme